MKFILFYKQYFNFAGFNIFKDLIVQTAMMIVNQLYKPTCQ
jgi:hypothetical protein